MIASDDERLIAGWNATSAPFQRHATVCDLVDAAAARWADRPAVIDDTGIAYRHGTLHARANRIAHHLRELGQRRGALVGFLGGHTAEAVAGLLGILKSGAAYVPLDPRWPFARLHAVLEPLNVTCLLHGRAEVARATELGWTLPAIRHLVCPEIDTPVLPAEPVDAAAVRELWNHVSSAEDGLEAAGFNVRSAGQALADDAEAYRARVVSLVRSAAPAGGRVLEIGCGAGFILRALARDASRYVAVDPSAVAVARIREWGRATGAPVEAVEAFAHEALVTIAGPFDVAVIASVAQFFPGPGYFDTVIAGVGRLLAPGGSIVVADVVDPAGGQMPDGLRLPRAYFADLAARCGTFGAVEIVERDRAGFQGELALRYDVVLRRGEPSGAPARRWWTGWHIAQAPADPPRNAVATDDAAYVIFTSGSTGQPKGVMVQHRAVVNLIEWVNRAYDVTPADRLLFVTSFCFDLSVYDMFGILAAGASIRVVSDARLGEPESLVSLIESEPITFWDSAPATFVALMPFARLHPPVARPGRVLVFLSGDWVPVSMPDEIRAWLPGARIVVLGGATEATVWANDFAVGAVDPGWASIPYGRPIQNARYHVLDDALRMCPVGEPGDLYIAGECLSLGYFDDAALTAAKFVPDPFSTTPGGRMYATGDRGRWQPDGNLEFLGRFDSQVKIRGFRIELGEIEATLKKYPGVLDSVAVAVGAGASRRLAAFVLAPSRPDPQRIVARLRTLLPPHMVPGAVQVLDAFPVGATGKTDRAALLRRAEQADRREHNEPPPAPAAPAQMVRTMWQSILMRADVGETDDFFDLGGHSLVAAQLVAEIREAFGIEFGVRELFERPRLIDVVRTIEARLSDGDGHGAGSVS
jgi:amino acid adenylation domain-containing protein